MLIICDFLISLLELICSHLRHFYSEDLLDTMPRIICDSQRKICLLRILLLSESLPSIQVLFFDGLLDFLFQFQMSTPIYLGMNTGLSILLEFYIPDLIIIFLSVFEHLIYHHFKHFPLSSSRILVCIYLSL